jgi:hypothetical protein
MSRFRSNRSLDLAGFSDRLLGRDPGAKWLASTRFGAGLDFAAIVPGQGKVFPNTLGVISPDGYFHFLITDKSDFFAVGGYSVIVSTFSANGVNAGIGWNYWFGENAGFTIEGRTIFLPGYQYPNPPDGHYTELRLGFTWR